MRDLPTSAMPRRFDHALRGLGEPLRIIIISTVLFVVPEIAITWWATPNVVAITPMPFLISISFNLLVYWVARGIGGWLRIPMLKLYYGGMLAMMTFYLLWFVLPAYTSGLYCLGEGHCFTQRPMLFHDVWPGFRWEHGDMINALVLLPVMIVAPISSLSVLLRALFRRRGGWLAILCAALALVAIVAGFGLAGDVISKYE
ncbi:hypothetical protein F8S13_10800 [Chloroflexia bacterium SDU3-3]|nr:hypothetical protein F8S13_10800 [Chloroflexia bacterium SDU3-3]